MGRITYQEAAKGTVFCIEWPEWHVECAEEDCSERIMVAGPGEIHTKKEAVQHLKNGHGEDREGWKEIAGKWYCPQHTPA